MTLPAIRRRIALGLGAYIPDYDIITYTRPDGEVINLSDPPYMTFGYDGFGIGEFESTTVSPPGVDGEWWYNTRMGAKVMSVDFGYFGQGVSERQDSRRTLVRLFNPLLGPGVLKLQQVNGLVREIDCILAESLPLPSDEFLGAGGYRTVVRFKSHGTPAFRDGVLQTAPVNSTSSPPSFTFPWTFPRVFAQSGFFSLVNVTNAGDINTPVRITLSGPMIDPKFINNTSGKTLSMVGLSLTSSDNLVIDTSPDKYVVQVNGVDAWQYLHDAEFWDLVPGENAILFDVGGTNVISTVGSVSWYNLYLGQ
jgi:hypothetical protein